MTTGPALRHTGAPSPPPCPGEFVECLYSGVAGTRHYKLYLPKGLTPHMPLVVMLHGCKQTPDDFAKCTRMNALADRHGFLVAYPAQPSKANELHCWNWFKEAEQVRDGFEPSTIAGITLDVQRNHHVDAKRIFVAGLSSGAAMAVILGVTHPEIFKAIGVHSGMPYGIAHDEISAFTAMQMGGLSSDRELYRGREPPATILFHGDADFTVNVRNATLLTNQLLANLNATGEFPSPVIRRQKTNGRAATVTEYDHPASHTRFERWIVHGADHAWSGGSAEGSYADPKGPDASQEMVRFFLEESAACSPSTGDSS